MIIQEMMQKSKEAGTSVTLVVEDPFTEGETYGVTGIVLEVNEEIRRVKVQSGQEVSWLPLDEIAEVISGK